MCLPIISPENWKPATRTDQGKGCNIVIDVIQDSSLTTNIITHRLQVSYTSAVRLADYLQMSKSKL